MIFEAHVEDKCSQSIFVRLSKECVTLWNLKAQSELQVEMRFVLSRLNFCEWHLAVDSLEYMDLVFLKDKHRETDNQIIHSFLQVDAGNLRILSGLFLDKLFNQEQKQAVAAIALSKTKTSSPPVLLLGPFGTGKTFTIAHVLRMLVKNSDNRILLCTHSNSAADLYIKEFFDIWYKADKHPKLKPIRIYYKLRALNTVGEQRVAFNPLINKGRILFLNGSLVILYDLGTSSCAAILLDGRTRSFSRASREGS